jgi:ABC transporter substrate binding protein
LWVGPPYGRLLRMGSRRNRWSASCVTQRLAYLLSALRRGLNEAGYAEDKKLSIESRWGGGQQDRLRGLADDLVRQNIDLIIAGGDAAIMAAKAATTTAPIVFVTGEDPVTLGFVDQLNQPTGTTTGVTFLSNTLRTKQLQLLHELVPNASVIGMLINSKIPASKDHIREQQAAASALGLSLQIVSASSERDFALDVISLNVRGQLMRHQHHSRNRQFVSTHRHSGVNRLRAKRPVALKGRGLGIGPGAWPTTAARRTRLWPCWATRRSLRRSDIRAMLIGDAVAIKASLN